MVPDVDANFLCGLFLEKWSRVSFAIRGTYDRKAEVVRPNLTNYITSQISDETIEQFVL